VPNKGWEDVCDVDEELQLGMNVLLFRWLFNNIYCNIFHFFTFSAFTNLHVLFHDAHVSAIIIVLNVEEQFIVK
jgi:hypothetical protein